MKDTMVMVTREEFEELVKLRILKATMLETLERGYLSYHDEKAVDRLFPGEFTREEENV